MKNGEKFKFSDSMIWCFGVLCQQGFHKICKNSSSLIISISALLFTLLLLSTFIVQITTKLTYEADPVTSVNDLYKYDFQIGMVQNSSDHSIVVLVSI